MTITIDLLPEETTRLVAEARQHGISMEEYIYQRLSNTQPRQKRRITELRGLGKEIWQGVDAREYIDELRDEPR